jgi:pyrroloquinoline quinone biosynthesis protein B
VALVDEASGRWAVIDPSPDITAQLHGLRARFPDLALSWDRLTLFLTHIHMGHYWGIGLLGKEGAGVRNVPVYAGAQAGEFLRQNHPFRRMIQEQRLRVLPLAENQPCRDWPEVRPVPVVHRDDFSETFGFLVQGKRRLFYMPDADRVTDDLLPVIGGADVALIDGTFFSADEIPGLSDGTVPHPPVQATMELLSGLDLRKTRVVFTHFNHTNPLLDPDGEARKEVEARGFTVAEDWQQWVMQR